MDQNKYKIHLNWTRKNTDLIGFQVSANVVFYSITPQSDPVFYTQTKI